MLAEAEGLHALVRRIFEALGSSSAEADAIARHLVGSNLAGHESHGVVRVPQYVKYVTDGQVKPNRRPIPLVDADALLLVDGDRGFGQSVGEEVLAAGVAKARAAGVALVGLRNVGHLGRIGGWAELAADQGLASLHFVNSPGSAGIQVAPFGARERRLAPNPLAIGLPRREGHPFLLDMTTSVIPEGKVRVALNAGTLLPEGAAVDADGRPTRCPQDYYGPPPGALLPLGGHKGYGLCMALDLLAGAITGGGWSDPRTAGFGNNMLSLYIDPEHMGGADYLAQSLRDLTAWVTSAAPAEPATEVLAPGDLEARLSALRRVSGIPLDPVTWRQLADAAAALGVDAAMARPA